MPSADETAKRGSAELLRQEGRNGQERKGGTAQRGKAEWPREEREAANRGAKLIREREDNAGYFAEKHGALALTLELPFKDLNNAPDPERGFSPERAMAMGATLLPAILEVLPQLR